ncbi:MAG: SpoIID/LytB domain-containing protein [Elusimicrobiaceae bacterium]|nr:SpoIID/LytB domain-containing protein [Elusimicrobiaceae bacterium]
MRKTFALTFLILFPFCAFGAVSTTTAPATLQSARELYFADKPEDALNQYIEISKRDKDKTAFLNAIFIALELAKPRLAVDTAAEALKLFPTDTTVLEFAARAYLANGHNIHAENLFSLLNTSKQEQNEFYQIGMARAQMGMGEDKLAETNLLQASKGTNGTLANFLLGELYFKEKDYFFAAKHYKLALDLDSQFLEAHKKYGDSLVNLKRYKEAWQSYKNVQAADAQYKEVVKVLKELSTLYTPPVNNLAIPEKTRSHTSIKSPENYTGKPFPKIRVGLGAKINGAPKGVSEIKFSTSHKFNAVSGGKTLVKNGENKTYWTVKVIKGVPYLISPKGKQTSFKKSLKITQESTPENAHTIIVKNMLVGHGTTWISREDKEYRGEMEFIYSPKAGGIYLVNHVNMEEYLYGVVASEMPSKFPIEALKAQAIIARTYAEKAKGKHKAWGYDLCDTQHCQVYGGVKSERERTNSAAEATQGLILEYNNKPIEAVFSSNCGGFTQSSKEAGWNDTPYLKPVSDYKNLEHENFEPYDFSLLLQYPQEAYSKYFNNVSKSNFRWVRYVEEPILRQVIARKKDIGKIKEIIILGRGRSGYVNKVKIIGTHGNLILTKENQIKKYLALGLLRSTYFTIEPVLENGKTKAFIFYGGGWGHGVGLCQTGAGGRAESGQDFKEILTHYYTNVDIKDIRDN